MTPKKTSVALIAAAIKSLAITGGKHSAAARIRPAFAHKVAADIALSVGGYFTDNDVLFVLRRYASQNPGLFFQVEELEAELRGASRDRNKPKAISASATVQEKLALLTPEQKLHYANTGQFPPGALAEKD